MKKRLEFYKREILQKNNLRFATETIISEDVLFNTLSLDYFHRIGYTKRYFYHYEQSDGSAQNKYRPNSDKYFLFVIEKIQEWLRKTKKNQHFIDAANCLFVHYIFGILKEDLFHKDNQSRNHQKKEMFCQLVSNTFFLNALRNANLRYFSLSERILLLLLQTILTAKEFCL